MANIQIKNTSLNSGTYVDMGAVMFTPVYKRLTESKPIRGQNTVSDYAIATGDNLGVEQPKLTLTGYIDTRDFVDNAALHATTSITEMTLGYLKALWRVSGTSQTYLKIYFGEGGNYTLKNFDGTSDEIEVLVDTVSPIPMQDSDVLHLIKYSITFTEIDS